MTNVIINIEERSGEVGERNILGFNPGINGSQNACPVISIKGIGIFFSGLHFFNSSFHFIPLRTSFTLNFKTLREDSDVSFFFPIYDFIITLSVKLSKTHGVLGSGVLVNKFLVDVPYVLAFRYIGFS